MIIKGQIITPSKRIKGSVQIQDGLIKQVVAKDTSSEVVYDFGDNLVVPGFIDIHMHGMGHHPTYEVRDLLEVSKMQTSFGTTAFLPTVSCLREKDYIQFAENVRQAQENADGAGILGAHFEGPFINPERKCGMDADYLLPMDTKICQRIIEKAGDVLKLMTLSPELKGGGEIIKMLVQNNIAASLGHSSATKQQLDEAIEAGLTHICHLFNTFEKTTVSENWPWKPGLIETILLRKKLTCELICDMQHVLGKYIKLAAKALGSDRFVAVTDSMPGTGLQPGEYKMIDGREFTTKYGIAKLSSNGLVVGSVLTMNKAFANLVQICGFDPITVSKYTSKNPAAVIGMDKKVGCITAGIQADIAVLDENFNCIATFINGKKVYGV